MKLCLILILTIISCLIIYSAAEEQSPLHVREKLRRILPSSDHRVRKRREIEVPIGTQWEVKWGINLPFETILNRYSSRIQIFLPVHLPFASILFDEYGMAKLAGYEIEEVDSEYVKRNDIQIDPRKPSKKSRKRTTRSLQYQTAAQKERLYLYKNFQGLFEKLGLPGKSCMFRTICEVAESPLDNGIFGDMMNMCLTPSLASSTQEFHSSEYTEYVKAEDLGHQGGSCGKKYSECEAPMMSLLPLIAKTMLNK